MAQLCTRLGYAPQAPLCPIRVLDRTLIGRNNDAVGNRLKELRDRAGMTQEGLAIALGTGRSTIVKLERGERPLNGRWLERLANHLNCSPAEILGDEVPIVGRIGAGGSVVFEDIGMGETIQRPPETTGPLIGLEVAGESMLPKFDPGDIIFISRERDGVDPSDIGSYCAARLRTGETYLKILARSSMPGRFTLRSWNAADMEDVELEWATPIRAVIPKSARRFS